MADLTDAEIDNLLREAEQRLSNGSKGAEPSKSQMQVKADAAIESRPAEPREKLVMRQVQKSKAPAKDTAGSDWFNLPKTDLTPQFKRDWQILRMRNVLDPSQQKKSLRAQPPAYSQVGEIIAGPTDYFSGRLTRKEKKRTLLEEAMGANNKDKLKGKYAGIQKSKTSGKKAFYKKLVAQRRKGT